MPDDTPSSNRDHEPREPRYRRSNAVHDRDDISVEKLSFPLTVVKWMVGSAIALCLFILNVTWELRSEIKDLNTRNVAQQELLNEKLGNLRSAIDNANRMQTVQMYEIQAVKFSLSQAGIRIVYPDK